MVGDWKSLLSNLGGTGPDPTLGRSAEAVVLPVDAAVLEQVEGLAESADTEGELEPGVQEGSLVAGAVEDKISTLPDETCESCSYKNGSLSREKVCEECAEGSWEVSVAGGTVVRVDVDAYGKWRWLWVGEPGEVWKMRGKSILSQRDNSDSLPLIPPCTHACTNTHTKIFNSILDSTSPGNNNMIGA